MDTAPTAVHSPHGEFLALAIEAASRGGAILEKYWGKITKISVKNFDGDLVTEADQGSEEAIIAYLLKETPTFGIIAEESGQQPGSDSDYAWVIDPLDGTTNYTHNYPMVCVSIALTFRGLPIVGVVLDPIHRELFEGAQGLGARLNGVPLAVTRTATLSQALLETGFAYDRIKNNDNNYREFCHLTQISQGVRRCGSAALALSYVASGRLDGFWERGLNPWDIAAGICLIREAGGTVTSYTGNPIELSSGRIVATNGTLHGPLIAALGAAKSSPIPNL